MTLPMARDLSRAGIRVCTIAPGIFGPLHSARLCLCVWVRVCAWCVRAHRVVSHGVALTLVCQAATPMMAAASDKVRDALLKDVVCPKRFGDPSEFAALVRTASTTVWGSRR